MLYTKALTTSITSKNFLKLEQTIYDTIEKRTSYYNSFIKIDNLSIINRKGIKHCIELFSNEKLLVVITGEEEENTETFYDQISALL